MKPHTKSRTISQRSPGTVCRPRPAPSDIWDAPCQACCRPGRLPNLDKPTTSRMVQVVGSARDHRGFHHMTGIRTCAIGLLAGVLLAGCSGSGSTDSTSPVSYTHLTLPTSDLV